MIRAHHAINPNHAVHSADVLTAPERHADHAVQHVPRATTPIRERAMKWGDVPRIADILNSIRGTP
jgi:hypothetical protein